jgi:glucokinase
VGEGGAVTLAVDIGGTKMAAGLVDEAGTLLHHHQVPTPPGADADTLFAALTSVIAQVEGAEQAVACGVGSGGPMTGFGAAVSPVNIPGWRQFPLRDRLAEHTGLPTFVDNDAKALALAEGWRGAAVGHDAFIGMVVSTGVGGGIVLDGRLLDGVDGNAGHIGHVIVEPEGRLCGCGAYGCLEAEASGTAIAAVTGRPPAEAGREVRVRTGRLVGRAVASVANLLDLRLAVVAGSVAIGYGDVFFEAAQAEIHRAARLEFSRDLVIRPAGLLDGAPLVGAAAVAWRGLGREILSADR